MYIKELEDRSKSNAQSESDRNRVLVQQTVELRREMLKLRSKVLKLSVSLNSIGSEVGKILDKEGPEKSAEDGGNVHPSPVHTDTEQAAAASGTLTVQTSEGMAEEGHVDQGNERSRNPIEAEPMDTVPGSETSEQPAEDSNSPRGDNASFDSEYGNNARHNSVGQIMDLDDCVAVVPQEHNLMDYPVHVSGSLPGEWVPNDPSLNPPQLFANVEHHEQALDLRVPDNISFSDLGSAPYSNPEEWMMCMSAPVQDLGFGTLEEEASESLGTAQQKMIGPSGLEEGPSTSIPAALSQIVPSLPPGLFPVAKGKNSYATFQMHSRLSEHIEALEQHVRCRLYSASDPISRQGPTKLQLTVPHSPIIDWVPYPYLRDRMILCYNGNVSLDRMICEYLNSHVIEVNDVSQILPHAPPGKGYFGVWNVYKGIYTAGQGDPDHTDLPISTNFLDVEPNTSDFSMQDDFSNETPNASLQNPALGGCLPNPCLTHRQGRRQSFASATSGPLNVVELLSTPELALRLSHDLRLYEAKSWRVDRSFFKAYPELMFDGYEKITAQGKSYRMFTEPPDPPVPMTEATVKIYHNELARVA
ncbi:hypothetical protein AK830_g6421 [Neonectria ditissima]|uniref:Uncharacterized protein n=1 Tax=Neonectria ditissima TaxID=78410 RepID=A0A0P7BCD6_9HYPO|nr:hypothetical protein AK830_g6421 [Neonectria ditissima]